MLFIKLRKFPSVPSLLRFFIRNECWISLNAFSASIEMIMWFLFFSLLTWWTILTDFQMLKQPSTLTGCAACWIQFVSILLRVYVSVFLRYWFVIFFSCNVFFWFLYWIILSSNNELGNILFLCSEKGSRELEYFFCKCWEEFTRESIWPWYFLF